MEAIYVENLTKKYRDSEVLKGVSLRIREGEFYSLMGPNGSGKTTLVSILASVRFPSSGEVRIYGRRPEQAKEFIGYVSQKNFSSPNLTGRENLVYFAKLLGYSGGKAGSLANELLPKVGLSEEADKRVSKYSGGMRKRLEVATALFPGIKLLILDEPTTGLDPSARRKFFSLIEELKGEDTTIMLITHIGTDAESASRVGLIDEGRIIAEGEPEKLKESSGIESVINLETTIKGERLVCLLREFSEKDKVLETEMGYRLYCGDSERLVPDIVRSLDKVGCQAKRVEIAKPSLEDVFFELTGKVVKEVG